MELRILPYGHETLSSEALTYVGVMAQRHGFKVLEKDSDRTIPFRIEVMAPLLKDRVFWAVESVPTRR
jgi:hypothetical protein